MVAVLGMMLVPAAGGVNAATAKIKASDLGIGYAEATGLGNRDVRSTIASIIRVALSLLGIVAVVIVIIGGVKWMTAGGNTDQVDEAKKWLFSGVIGLAIILAAYALAEYVIQQLVNATTGTVTGGTT